MTDEIIQSWPRWKRWGLYAFGALTITGVLPTLGVWALDLLCQATTYWILVPLLAVVFRAFWRLAFE